MASHTLSDCVAQTVVLYNLVGYHFLKTGDCWHLCQQGTAIYSKCSTAKCL